MRKLRIAIITEHHTCFNWQHSVISQLKNSPYVDIVFRITSKQEINHKESIPFIWKLFQKIDSKFFKPNPNATAKKDISKLFDNISSIKSLELSETSKLDDEQIDIIINLLDINPSDELIKTSKYGVWFLTHCNLDTINKRPYAIWEMLQKEPETVGVLRYIKDKIEFPKTIDQTSSCTDALSYTRNLNDILWQSHLLIINNIELLAKDENLFENKLKSKSNIYPDKAIEVSNRPPSNIKILGFSLQLYYKKLKHLIKSKFYLDQWALIFLNNTEHLNNPYELKNYKTILPPKDRFWADPFLIKNNDKYYLFIEELIYKNKLGHLSVMEIDKDGNYTKPETIMVKDYHLSYPSVFEDNGEFYMIPETSGNNNIQLYKCNDFPLKWELEKVLMTDVIAVDTTIYKEDDTYWMFTNLKKHKGVSKHAELYLFSSKDLMSDNWVLHPLNPIKTDIKTARPAGGLFKNNNKVYRPSQNCSNHYGYGLNIAEITKLSDSEFEEKIIEAIRPNWDKNIHCTHSFNSVDNLYVSDIKIKRSRFL